MQSSCAYHLQSCDGPPLDKHHVHSDVHHGFRTRRSCETQLLTTVHQIWEPSENIKQVDAVVLDFGKAFDTVPHHCLLNKLHHFDITFALPHIYKQPPGWSEINSLLIR